MIKKIANSVLKFIYPIRGKENEESYGEMDEADKMIYWYLPCIIMTILPFSAFVYLFWGHLDPNKIPFSNDGPIGVMMSQYVQDGYPPGQPMWNDLYWLGQGSGVTPVGITNTLYWVFCNPPLFLTVFFCFILFILYVLKQNQKSFDRLQRREESVAPERPPEDRRIANYWFRALFLIIVALFYFFGHHDGNTPPPDPTIFSRIVAFSFLFYANLLIPLWISTEMEHKDFLEMTNKNLENKEKKKKLKT